MTRNNTLILLLLMIFCGCIHKRDFSVYQYQAFPLEEPFSIFFSDSTLLYDIDLSSRISNKYQEDYLTLNILYTSPSGQHYTDTVKLPTHKHSVKLASETNKNIEISQSKHYYDIAWSYRKNISDPEKGDWQVNITNTDSKDAIIGIGIKVYPQKDEQ